MVAVVLFATGLLLIGVIVAVRGLPPSFETVLSLLIGGFWGAVSGLEAGNLLDALGMGGGGFFALPSSLLYIPLGLLAGPLLGVIAKWLLAQSRPSTTKAVIIAAFSLPLGAELGIRIFLSDNARLRRACNRGDMFSCATLGGVYLDDGFLPGDHAKGLALVDKACAGGNAESCYALGSRFLVGSGVPVNRVESQRYFQLAAANWAAACHQHFERGWVACTSAASLYVTDRAGSRRMDLANELLWFACERNVGDACSSLSDMILDQESVGITHEQRDVIIARACKASNRKACAAADAGP